MKNYLKVIAIASVIAVFSSSCKTHEKCPAFGKYGKADMKKSSVNTRVNS